MDSGVGLGASLALDAHYMERAGDDSSHTQPGKRIITFKKSGSGPTGSKRAGKRTSVQLQKFIEKKKRQIQMKKSLELTIEVGK